MIAKFIQVGKLIDYTPAVAVAAGDIIAIGNNHFGVAPVDIAAGELGSLQVKGVFQIPKAAGAITAGSLVYWTAGTLTAGTVAVSNAYIGRACASAADGDDSVLVAINASNIGVFTSVTAAAAPTAASVTGPTTETIAGTDYAEEAAIIKAAIDQNDANIDALKTCIDALIAKLKTNGILS